MSIVIEGDRVTITYGRMYDGGSFETCCPVSADCLWRPHGRNAATVKDEIRAHEETHREPA